MKWTAEYYRIMCGGATVAAITLVWLAALGCQSDSVIPKQYGFLSVEVIRQLELSDGPCDLEIEFESARSTDFFDVRVFYPDLEYRRFHAASESLEILRSLDSFRLCMIDQLSGDTLDEYSVEFSGSLHGHILFESEGKPLALWPVSAVSVQRGRKYRIFLQLPSRGTSDTLFWHPLLVGGDKGPVFP